MGERNDLVYSCLITFGGRNTTFLKDTYISMGSRPISGGTRCKSPHYCPSKHQITGLEGQFRPILPPADDILYIAGRITDDYICKNRLPMKRFVFVIAALMASAAMVQAQDLITKKDGQDIEAKVLEVSPNEVKYKLYDEPDGATYIVKKSELLMIRYESGRNEVFNNNSQPGLYYTDREAVENITVGMKYKELKHLYNFREYTPALADRYSPAWSGVASFFIPGLGQMICNEVGRGFAFLGGAIGGSILAPVVMLSGATVNSYGEVVDVNPGAAIAGLAISAGVAALDIIAIIDGIRVAKVKNMYEQDLRKAYSLEMNVYPSVNYAKIGNTCQPTAGITLAVRF